MEHKTRHPRRLPRPAQFVTIRPPRQGNPQYAVLDVRYKDYGNGPEVCFISAGSINRQPLTAIPFREQIYED